MTSGSDRAPVSAPPQGTPGDGAGDRQVRAEDRGGARDVDARGTAAPDGTVGSIPPRGVPTDAAHGELRAPVGAAAPGDGRAGVAPMRATPAAPGSSAPAPSRPARRRYLLLLLLGLPLALLAGFVAFLRTAINPPMPVAGETDGIVVLTGGSERVGTGFRLLADSQARQLLISGAHPEASLPEIAAAAGIDPARFAGRVTIGHAAASTRGNAAEAAAWARAGEMRSLRIVTAGYHMPRAMLEMRRALPGMQLVAHPVPSAALRARGALRRPQLWALLAGEYARYLGAWAGLSGAFVPRREPQAT